MASRTVKTAPRAINEKSARTRLADRPNGTQAVVSTTHADSNTAGIAPTVGGDEAATTKPQSIAAAPDQPARKKPNQSEALKSNASKGQSLVRDKSVSGEYVDSPEPQKPQEREVEPISRATLSSPHTTMERLHKMSERELGVLDALENEGRRIIKKRLIVIWEEMSARFERGESVNGISGTGGKGMGKYLRSIGVDPAKRRSWKFEISRETVQKLSQESPERRRIPKKKEVIITVQTEADRIAKAGVKIAQALANDNETPQEERVNKAGAMAKDLLDAIEDGEYERLESLSFSEKEPESQKFEPIPEPEPGSLNDLGQRVSRMADTDDIVPAVRAYLELLFEPLRKQGLVLTFQVSARREGRERVDSGDWVELISSRSTDNHLGRVVGRDKLKRPVIRPFTAGAWQKPKSHCNNSRYKLHVLSEAEARDKYPAEFRCYRPINKRQRSAEKSEGGP